MLKQAKNIKKCWKMLRFAIKGWMNKKCLKCGKLWTKMAKKLITAEEATQALPIEIHNLDYHRFEPSYSLRSITLQRRIVIFPKKWEKMTDMISQNCSKIVIKDIGPWLLHTWAIKWEKTNDRIRRPSSSKFSDKHLNSA